MFSHVTSLFLLFTLLYTGISWVLCGKSFSINVIGVEKEPTFVPSCGMIMDAKVAVTISVIVGVVGLVQGQVVEPKPEVETRTLGHLLGFGTPNVGSVAGGLIGSLVGGFLGAEDEYYGGGYAPGYGGGYGGSPFIGGRPVYPKRPSGYHRTGYPYDVNYYEYSNVPPYYNRPYILRK